MAEHHRHNCNDARYNDRLQKRTKTKRAPPGLPDGAQKSAMTYFPSEKYHRQRKLNCCVRDGNRCFLSLILTDNPADMLFSMSAGLIAGTDDILTLNQVASWQAL